MAKRANKKSATASPLCPFPWDARAVPPIPCHGSWWKRGSGRMDKDCATDDYDALDVFLRVREPRMLWAAQDRVLDERRLLDTCAVLSRGQYRRLQREAGALFGVEADAIVDRDACMVGVRQRGGGRAATLFEGYTVEPLQAVGAFDVKGVGTCELQESFPSNATGLLALKDALKEVVYERVINQVLQKSGYSTVRTVAIIGLPLRYQGVNPATGYENDTCCLLVREQTSRLMSSPDDPVFYGVAQQEQLHSKHASLLDALSEAGISSLQRRDDDYSWNIQTDATEKRLVDFSHFYCTNRKTCPLLAMSEKAERLAEACASGNVENEQDRIRMEKAGRVGLCKPAKSWSWYLETDDSPLTEWISSTSGNEDRNYFEEHIRRFANGMQMNEC